MFNAEFSEFLLFGRQLGLALAGAVCVWGFVFTKWSKHRAKETSSCIIYEWLGARLLFPLAAGFFIALLSWFLLSFFLPAYAHEGIGIVATENQRSLEGEAANPFVFLWILAFAGGYALRGLWPKHFQKHMEWFYALQLGFVVLLMMMFSWHGAFDKAQVFFWGHTVHSILTLGTVLVLDFLFLTSKSSALLKQHIYPLFSTISKVIWVGLGIDFLSVALIFQGAVNLTPQFFFMQTVVGILIVNGVLLAGPIARKMMTSVKEGGKQLTKKWERIGDVAGVISISSWGTITFVDFFAKLNLTYLQFFSAYLSLIVLLFLGHLLWEYFEKEPPAILGLEQINHL